MQLRVILCFRTTVTINLRLPGAAISCRCFSASGHSEWYRAYAREKILDIMSARRQYLQALLPGQADRARRTAAYGIVGEAISAS